MTEIKHLYAKSPCRNCPFKKDTLKSWLGKSAALRIADASIFVCHKDITKQCAGHMLLKNEENQFFQLAKRLNIDLKLIGAELVFNNEADFISHHS